MGSLFEPEPWDNHDIPGIKWSFASACAIRAPPIRTPSAEDKVENQTPSKNKGAQKHIDSKINSFSINVSFTTVKAKVNTKIT